MSENKRYKQHFIVPCCKCQGETLSGISLPNNPTPSLLCIKGKGQRSVYSSHCIVFAVLSP